MDGIINGLHEKKLHNDTIGHEILYNYINHKYFTQNKILIIFFITLLQKIIFI